jgi:hypothetical protein
MAIELVPLSSPDIEALAAFLTKHFKMSSDVPQWERAKLQWKYFEARPDWDGARSYVLQSGNRWLAHAGVCPAVLECGAQKIRTIQLLDWVSASPGAGAEIFRRFYPQIDALLSNGGSGGARRTYEALGHTVLSSVDYFMRPLKPWGLFRTRVSKGWAGALARLARNAAVASVPLYSPEVGWKSERLPIFLRSHQALCGGIRALPFWQAERSPELGNYFLKCPLAKMSAYQAGNSSVQGYFILADLGTEIRLVDVRISSDRPEHWASMVSSATREAARSSAAIMTTFASFPLMKRALQANRFRWFQADPLYLYDPKGLLPKDASLHITPCDGDQAYL